MIVVKPVGGLANQLVIYAAAKALALHENKKIYLDLSHYNINGKRNFRFDELNIDYNVIEANQILKQFGLFTFSYNRFFRKLSNLLNKITFLSRNCLYEESLVYDSRLVENVNTSLKAYVIGDFISYKYYNEILEDLKIECKPIWLSDDFKSALRSIDTFKSASIHFRRGDYKHDSNAKAFHGLLDIAYYKQAVSYLNLHYEIETYYVFTDDIKDAQSQFDFIDNVVFLSNAYTLTDLDELELMKNIKFNIIANSGFSRWAGLLNVNKDVIVIMPERWFRSYEIPTSEIAPPNWIRIPSVFVE